MSIFFYNLRPEDELPFARQCSEQYGIPFGYCLDYPSPENYHLAKGYDAVSCTPCDMSRPVVEAFHDLGVKYITTRSIGIDHIDRVRARELGMRVGNVTYPSTGVASYAVMLILMCSRRMGDILARAAVQDYTLKDKIGEDITDITDMTVGIVGTGKIATAAARQLSGFGCTILYYGHHENEEMARFGTQVPLEELLTRSDAITLHTNATDANHHMIDAAAMETMKDGVILVNTARGKLIDTDALIEALERGKVGAPSPTSSSAPIPPSIRERTSSTWCRDVLKRWTRGTTDGKRNGKSTRTEPTRPHKGPVIQMITGPFFIRFICHTVHTVPHGRRCISRHCRCPPSPPWYVLRCLRSDSWPRSSPIP